MTFKIKINYESLSSFKKKESLLLLPDTIAVVDPKQVLGSVDGTLILVNRVVVVGKNFHVYGGLITPELAQEDSEDPITGFGPTTSSELLPYHKNRELLPQTKAIFQSVLPITFFKILRGKYVYPV